MLFGITFVYLVLSFGSFSPVSVVSEKLSHSLFTVVIKEGSYRNIEHPEIFGIESKNLNVRAQNWNEQMTPTFAGVASNFLPQMTEAGLATRQKLKLGGITEEEMLYL